MTFFHIMVIYSASASDLVEELRCTVKHPRGLQQISGEKCMNYIVMRVTEARVRTVEQKTAITSVWIIDQDLNQATEKKEQQ